MSGAQTGAMGPDGCIYYYEMPGMQTYDEAAWAAWGESQWDATAGYEHMQQYDCSAWGMEYQDPLLDQQQQQQQQQQLSPLLQQQQQQQHQQQPQQQQQPQPPPPSAQPPAPGVELLTELRLAELKRLIDRDSRQPPPQTAPEAGAAPFIPTGQVPCMPQTSMEAGAAPFIPAAQAQAMASAGAAPPAAAVAAPLLPPPPPVQEQRAGGEAVVSELEKVAAPMKGPFLCWGDFGPSSRNHKELPVKEGEALWIEPDSEPICGWLWVYKDDRDQGWIPAAAISLFAHLEDDETEDNGISEESDEDEDEDEDDDNAGAGAGAGAEAGRIRREEDGGDASHSEEASEQEKARLRGRARRRRGRGADEEEPQHSKSGDWWSGGGDAWWGWNSGWGAGDWSGGHQWSEASHHHGGGGGHGKRAQHHQEAQKKTAPKAAAEKARPAARSGGKADREPERPPPSGDKGDKGDKGASKGKGGKGHGRAAPQRERAGLKALMERLNAPLVVER